MLLLQGERYAVFLRVDFALDQQDVHLETTFARRLSAHPTPLLRGPRCTGEPVLCGGYSSIVVFPLVAFEVWMLLA